MQFQRITRIVVSLWLVLVVCPTGSSVVHIQSLQGCSEAEQRIEHCADGAEPWLKDPPTTCKMCTLIISAVAEAS